MPNPFLVDDPNWRPSPQAAGRGPNPFVVNDGSPAPPSYAEDIAKTIPSGAARGVAGLVGLPGDVMDLAGRGWRYAFTKMLENTGIISPEQGEVLRNPLPAENYYKSRQQGLPTSHDLVTSIESITGHLYKPQTVPGEYANTLAEFAPAAVLGAGTLGQRAAQVAVPALAAETAGQAARGIAPDMEGIARIVGALGGAGGVALAQMPRSPTATLQRGLTGADTSAIQRAEALIQSAAAQGVRLTWDEAIQHVTGNATRLSDLRRVVENSRGGGDVLKPMMAERPGQVRASGDAAIGSLAPNRMEPLQAGMALQRAAEREIADTQAAINAATRPYYASAGSQKISPTVYQALSNDPLYSRALSEIRGNPALNRGIESLSDDSVAVVDLVQRRLREMAEGARAPGQAHTSNLVASNLEDARTGAVRAAEQATGGPTGSYAMARLGQSMLRDQHLAPLTEGPIGQIAATSDILKQGRSLLTNAPASGSAPAVADTVTRLAMRHPKAAENLIHARVRAAFDEATQNIQGGPNQWGGANFAANIAGNGQQAQNLEAAVRALPNGDARWNGFRKFLDIMEATGRRPQMGSPTAPNQLIQQELRGGGVVPEAIAAAKTGGVSLIKRFNDFREQMLIGRNAEQIARILSNPSSGRLLERLASEPANSSRAAMLAFRLSYMGRTAQQGGQSNPQSQK